MKDAWKSLAAVCALVIGVYAYMAQSGVLELRSPTAADTFYNLLVQAFRARQLNLKTEVPPGLAQLADPYDPTANVVYWASPYRLLDLSYYKGKFYLYWGITPALILFWPYTVLTGHYLFHRHAVIIFCSLGFLTSVGLLRALWRRYFPETSVGVVAACALALGLAAGAPILLSQSDVYEVAIGCGYMLTMLALAAIWCALHEPERRGQWLAVASLAYGLAVGARPSLVFGAAILLVPVARAWRDRRKIGALLLAATGPILLIVSGLLLYNFRRFDNPFEFGMHYQLSGEKMVTHPLFDPHYLWFNFQVYFLESAHWSVRSPFVHGATVPPFPPGYTQVRNPFGVLPNIPLVWLALAVPWAWRSHPEQAGSILRWFEVSVALLFGISAVTVCLFCGSANRYEVDFLPELLWLAALGIFGLERAPAPTLASNRIRGQESGQACRPLWRRAVRWGWSLLLGFSVAFNLLASVEYCAEAHYNLGSVLFQQGGVPEAIAHYEQALRLNPDYVEAHNNLGLALVSLGRVKEAIGHFEQALRSKPDYADAHDNLGVALVHQGEVKEAIGHFEQAQRIKPDDAEVHNNLGVALEQAGRIEEAIAHFEQALRIKSDDAEVHYNLGNALAQVGRVPEAIVQYKQALRIEPDYAAAHYNLGNALLTQGKARDAMVHYEEALRINPDDAGAHYNLGNALLQAGKLEGAIEHFVQALRIKPDYAEAHNDVGTALAQSGKIEEAIAHHEQALRLNPDYVEAHNNLGIALMRSGRVQEAMGHFEQALRIKPDLAEVHDNLGNALAQVGRVPEAIVQYEQALRIKPDFTQAQNALARLQGR